MLYFSEIKIIFSFKFTVIFTRDIKIRPFWFCHKISYGSPALHILAIILDCSSKQRVKDPLNFRDENKASKEMIPA